MSKTTLLSSTAIALLLCAAPAYAQMQQNEKQQTPGAAKGGERANEKATPSPKAAEPRGGESKAEQTGRSKSRAQSEPAEKTAPKGSARTEGKEPAAKGAARSEEKKSTKGSAQSEEKKAGKGNAQNEPGRAGTKGAETGQGKVGTKGAQTKPGAGGRVQLSEQQRTSVHDTVLKERNVNRATRANFAVNVGTRIPRSVRLALLPAAVVTLVPQYRSYRYVVIDDRICIVDPGSYEIVEVIEAPGQVARVPERGGHVLALTEAERMIVVQSIDVDRGSTLALGALSEGAPVPRGVRLEAFPERVVGRVPKLGGYKFFTAENRIAIVDPEGARVQLIIDAGR